MTEPRNRSRFTDDPQTDFVSLFNPNTGQVVERAPYATFFREENMTDYVVPNFNSRIESGEIINNPMTYTAESVTVLPSQVEFQQVYNADPQVGTFIQTKGSNTANQLFNYCSFSGYNSADSVLSFPCEQEAKARALANVDSTPYEFFEDFAEIRETINFLRNPLAAISNLARAYKRKRNRAENIKDAISRAEALADLWAQYRFAFSPLLRSIQSGLDALADQEITRPVRRNAHGYSFDKDSDEQDYAPWTGGVGTQVVYQYQKTSHSDRKVHASILYEVENPLVDWNFKLGIRGKDIPVTAWELFPLSFVFDRLWNLKNIISGLVNLADPNVKIHAGSVTDRITHDATVSCVGMYSPYGIFTWTITKPDEVKFTEYHQSREIWSPSVADVVSPLTPSRPFSDIASILDLIALTITRLK